MVIDIRCTAKFSTLFVFRDFPAGGSNAHVRSPECAELLRVVRA